MELKPNKNTTKTHTEKQRIFRNTKNRKQILNVPRKADYREQTNKQTIHWLIITGKEFDSNTINKQKEFEECQKIGNKPEVKASNLLKYSYRHTRAIYRQ